MDETSWSPNRKIVAAALATLAVWAAQQFAGLDIPVGVEGALAVVVGYLVPERD